MKGNAYMLVIQIMDYPFKYFTYLNLLNGFLSITIQPI